MPLPLIPVAAAAAAGLFIGVRNSDTINTGIESFTETTRLNDVTGFINLDPINNLLPQSIRSNAGERDILFELVLVGAIGFLFFKELK